MIEQAKGTLSARANIDMDTAFTGMRRYARNHNQRLTDVAEAIVDGSLRASTVLGSEPPASDAT